MIIFLYTYYWWIEFGIVALFSFVWWGLIYIINFGILVGPCAHGFYGGIVERRKQQILKDGMLSDSHMIKLLTCIIINSRCSQVLNTHENFGPLVYHLVSDNTFFFGFSGLNYVPWSWFNSSCMFEIIEPSTLNRIYSTSKTHV